LPKHNLLSQEIKKTYTKQILSWSVSFSIK